MGKRGPQPGNGRSGGRKAGTKNKATIERELLAEQEMAARIIDRARSGETFELARDVLGRMMRLAEGAAGLHKPPDASDKEGSWSLFGEWCDRTIYCAKELAKYQSPTFKAIEVSQSPDRSGDDAVPINVLGIKDAKVLQITYQKMLKASVGK